ncbi:MAG TPA: SUMF1/EgtB/PvdO family nonheme iron enzyme [Prolixibacteraceae bacterium]
MKQKDRMVKVKSFQLSKYEITNSQYVQFLNDQKIGSDGQFNGLQLINVFSEDLQLEYKNEAWDFKSGMDNYPMVMVSYYGADEFCKWIGGKLPSETEWTYAAKGGKKTRNYLYAGSDNLEEVGWFKGNCEGHLHEVGKKKPNELGIFDMSGNAWEWCRNDSLKSNEGFCLHMGGSWYPGEQPSQISAHYGNTPTHFSNSVGFRVAFPGKKRVNRLKNM